MLDNEKLIRRLIRAADRTLEKYDQACERHQVEVQVFQADVARRIREYSQGAGKASDESALDRLRRANRAEAGEGPRSRPSPPSPQPPSSPPPPASAAYASDADSDESRILRDRLRATEADLIVAQERERRLQAELALAQERQRSLEREAEVARLREQLAAARSGMATPILTSRPTPASTLIPATVEPSSAVNAPSAPGGHADPAAKAPEIVAEITALPTAVPTTSTIAPEVLAESAAEPAEPVIIPEVVTEAPTETPRPTAAFVLVPTPGTADDDPDPADDRSPLDRARRALDRGELADARRHFAAAEAEARHAWTGALDTRPAAHVLAAALRGGAEVALELADIAAALTQSGEAVALVLDLHVASPSALTLCDLLASLRIKATALLAAGCPRDAEAQIIDALQLFDQEDPRHKDIDAGYEVTFLAALQDEIHRPADAPRT